MDISKPEVGGFSPWWHKALEQSSGGKQGRVATGLWYGPCPGYKGIDMV